MTSTTSTHEIGNNLAGLGNNAVSGATKVGTLFAIADIVKAVAFVLIALMFMIVFLYGMYKGEVKQRFATQPVPTFTEWLQAKYMMR